MADLNSILSTVKDPAVLNAMATFAQLAPPPEGPILAAALRLAAAWIQHGLDAAQVDAIVARYSLEAQTLADSW